MRIHSTSMGAPRLSTERPARSRTTERRPSAPTVSVGADFQLSRRRVRSNAEHGSGFFNDFGDLSFHPQMKRRIPPGMLGNKIQEIPLRH